jgi:hypothetical protein
MAIIFLIMHSIIIIIIIILQAVVVPLSDPASGCFEKKSWQHGVCGDRTDLRFIHSQRNRKVRRSSCRSVIHNNNSKSFFMGWSLRVAGQKNEVENASNLKVLRSRTAERRSRRVISSNAEVSLDRMIATYLAVVLRENMKIKRKH